MYNFECYEFREGANGIYTDTVSIPSQQEANVWVYFHERFVSILIEPKGVSLAPPRFDIHAVLDFVGIYNLRSEDLGNCAYTCERFVLTLAYEQECK